VPRQFLAAYVDPTRPYVVHVVVEVRDDGVPEVRRTMTDARPGTDLATVEQRLPLASIRDAAVRAAAEQEATETTVARPSRGTRRVFTPALLDEIAEVVRDAEARGLPVRRAVAEHFRLPEMTARNWINKARDREKKKEKEA